jgi:hypothetical protein
VQSISLISQDSIIFQQNNVAGMLILFLTTEMMVGVMACRNDIEQPMGELGKVEHLAAF